MRFLNSTRAACCRTTTHRETNAPAAVPGPGIVSLTGLHGGSTACCETLRHILTDKLDCVTEAKQGAPGAEGSRHTKAGAEDPWAEACRL